MLPTHLIIEDRTYQLIRNRNRWHLYARPSMMPNWGAYVIIKADILCGEPNYGYPSAPLDGENICNIKCGNYASVCMKFNDLVNGSTANMKWRPYARKTSPTSNDLELLNYSRLSIHDAFAALEGLR